MYPPMYVCVSTINTSFTEEQVSRNLRIQKDIHERERAGMQRKTQKNRQINQMYFIDYLFEKEMPHM